MPSWAKLSCGITKDSKSLIDLEEDRNRNEKRNTWLDRNNCRGGFEPPFWLVEKPGIWYTENREHLKGDEAT